MLEFHKVLFLDLSCFYYILMTLFKTLTPLCNFLLTILACTSLSMTPYRLLNLDLAKIHRWAEKWQVTFNPEKLECILLTRKYNKPYHPPVLLNRTQIAEVNCHKHLGIIFSNDCTWNEHLELVRSKAW